MVQLTSGLLLSLAAGRVLAGYGLENGQQCVIKTVTVTKTSYEGETEAVDTAKAGKWAATNNGAYGAPASGKGAASAGAWKATSEGAWGGYAPSKETEKEGAWGGYGPSKETKDSKESKKPSKPTGKTEGYGGMTGDDSESYGYDDKSDYAWSGSVKSSGKPDADYGYGYGAKSTTAKSSTTCTDEEAKPSSKPGKDSYGAYPMSSVVDYQSLHMSSYGGYPSGSVRPVMTMSWSNHSTSSAAKSSSAALSSLLGWSSSTSAAASSSKTSSSQWMPSSSSVSSVSSVFSSSRSWNSSVASSAPSTSSWAQTSSAASSSSSVWSSSAPASSIVSSSAVWSSSSVTSSAWSASSTVSSIWSNSSGSYPSISPSASWSSSWSSSAPSSAVSSAPPAPSCGVLTDPSFELGDTSANGWRIIADNTRGDCGIPSFTTHKQISVAEDGSYIGWGWVCHTTDSVISGQTLYNLLPGKTYELSFWLYKNTLAKADILIDGTVVKTIAPGEGNTWTKFSTTFVPAAATAVLGLANSCPTNDGGCGLLWDNFQLTPQGIPAGTCVEGVSPP